MTGDLRLAVRSLARRPGYFAASVVTLALGIGATTAVFSLAAGILFTALPYPEADRLVAVFEANRQGAIRPPSWPTFEDWRAESHDVFEEFAYAYGRGPAMPTDEGPVRVLAAYVSDGFFRTLGTAPAIGRTFATDSGDDESGFPIVVSHRFWQRRMGGTADATARRLTLDGTSFDVVGVMPPEFELPTWADVWTVQRALPPAGRSALLARDRHADAISIGRLRAGVSPDAARGRLALVAERHAAAYPETGRDWTGASLQGVREQLLGDAPRRIAIFGIAVLMALAVCCVNVMNLSLARGSARSRELAVRTALGANRRRLVNLVFAESVLVAACGGALGAYAAWAGVAYLRSAAPTVLPRLHAVTLDARVLAFAAGVTALCAVAFGLVPAVRAARQNVGSVLRGNAGGGSAPRSEARVRNALVAVQVAVALALTVSTALLVQSVLRLEAVDPGFDTAALIAVRAEPPATYTSPGELVALYERLAAAVRDTPGVESAALTNHVPLGGAWMPSRIVVEDPDPDSGGEVLFRTVSPEYFNTMRIRLEAGRAFAPSDLAGSDALIVNATLAARYWPGGSAVGRRLTVFKSVQGRADFGEPVTGTVVGVIRDVRHVGLAAQVAPEVYLPYTVNPPTWISIVARGSAASGALIPAIRRRLLDIEPQLPMEGAIAPVQERIETTLAARGFTARVMSSLTIPALLLTVIGIWGVIAFAVLHRKREMGIRLALGATPGGLPLTIIRHSLPWIGAGLVAGAGGALLLGRATAGLLFGVASADLTTLVIGVAVVAVVSFLAAWLPARAASRVDPIQVLRAE